jgi:hypothetical protein
MYVYMFIIHTYISISRLTIIIILAISNTVRREFHFNFFKYSISKLKNKTKI